MPTIPSYLAREGLPSTGGVPRGTVAVPVVQQPGAPAAGVGALDAALGAIPKGLEDAGALAVGTEVLQAHREKAFETLNATTQGIEFRPDLATAVHAIREAGDWQNMPTLVKEEGERLIQERSAKLKTPYARALFEQHAKETLSVTYQRALDEQTKRTEQVASFTFAQTLQQGQEAYAAATNDYERLVAKGQMQETGRLMVESGLFDGPKIAAALKQTFDGMQTELVKSAIQANPGAMRTQLLAQIHRKETDPNLPLAPPDKVAELAHEAWQIQHQALGEKEHEERLGDYRQSKGQEQAAADIYARMSIIAPTPENAAAYDKLLAEVNQKAQGEHPTISFQAQKEFGNHLRTLKAAALHPREVDDGPTERKLTTLIDAADSIKDLEYVRGVVYQQSGMLKPPTYERMLNSINQRKSKDHYSNLAGYREGIRIITGTEPGESSLLPMMRPGMREAEQVRLRTTLDLYRSRMAEIASHSVDQANAEGPQIATELRREQMEVPSKEEKPQRLPRPLLGHDGKTLVRDKEQATRIIQGMSHVTNADRQRLFEQWQEAVRDAPAAGATTPQPSGRQKVTQ